MLTKYFTQDSFIVPLLHPLFMCMFFCFVVGQVPMIKPPATLPECELLKDICKINIILHKNIVRENLKCTGVYK